MNPLIIKNIHMSLFNLCSYNFDKNFNTELNILIKEYTQGGNICRNITFYYC